jgi:hypothetical protein
MEKLTKAALIAANPSLGLKLSQTKDSMLATIKASKKESKTSKTATKDGQRPEPR